MTEATAERVPRAAPATLLDRIVSVTPVALLAIVLLGFYWYQASTRRTPWLFTDELEWTQLSRSIAETGRAARRGEPIYFKSLYSYLIAPAWWLPSTGSAYATIKYLNTTVMTTAAIPTYLLARMLVSRAAATAAAVAAVCIPGMAFGLFIIPESLAYPWFALASWLSVRALVTKRPRDVALAVAVGLGGQLIRPPELGLTVLALAIAAAVLWVTGPRGRALRADWTRVDYAGVALLAVGAFVVVNRAVLQHVTEWQVTTQYWKGRIFDLGLTAASAFTIGLGVLPVIAGIAALWLPDPRLRASPVYRAFAAYVAAAIVVIGTYTGVKAAYLSTVFATLTEERNLVYLAPLLLVATALAFEARRVNPWVATAVAVFALYLVLAKPYQLDYPYFEAPGYGILTMANRNFSWGVGTLKWALGITTAVALAIALLPTALERIGGRARGAARAVGAVATVALLAWFVAGEVTDVAGSDNLASRFAKNLPHPLDWVDRATGDGGVTYLGQHIGDPNGVNLTEFWNRSIDHVYSLDGTAPGPGPTLTPDLLGLDGRLSADPGQEYVLADNGVEMVGKRLATRGDLRLFRVAHPWRLAQALQGVAPDGWMSAQGDEDHVDALFARYASRGRDSIVVSLSRTGFCGPAPTAWATITVGRLRIDEYHQPALGRVLERKRVRVLNCRRVGALFVSPPPPYAVFVRIAPTFVPARYGGSDTRHLGAQLDVQTKPLGR